MKEAGNFAVESALRRAYGERAVTALIHIDALLTRAARSVERGREWYDSDCDDGIPRLACEALAIKIGEASTRVPAGLRKDFPNVPWVELSDLRNFLIHEYDATDYNILWDTLESDFPEAHRQVREVLGRQDR